MSEQRLRVKLVAASILAATTVSWLGPLTCWSQTRASPASSPLSYVGSAACAQCHRPEAELWHKSQHKHAMALATDQSVLGDFNNASYDNFGTRSRFFRRDGKFFVETHGPDGIPATFQIKYTFGIYPLQQYLIAFPDGRIQALSIAWDSRPKKQGGQRWFHLYPKEKIGHNDILYWTKLNQNWNYMCAECHSTDVHKNYNEATNRFATTWSEISVGCEACHGPGSRHIAWAQAQKDADSSNRDPTMASPFISMSDAVYRGGKIQKPACQSEANRQRPYARKSRPAVSAMPDAASFQRTGCRANGCLIRTKCRCLIARPFRPMARCVTMKKLTTMPLSNRARCLRKASPAATVIIRIVPSCVRQGAVSASNVIRR
jgi:hypothetical protein